MCPCHISFLAPLPPFIPSEVLDEHQRAKLLPSPTNTPPKTRPPTPLPRHPRPRQGLPKPSSLSSPGIPFIPLNSVVTLPQSPRKNTVFIYEIIYYWDSLRQDFSSQCLRRKQFFRNVTIETEANKYHKLRHVTDICTLSPKCGASTE